MNRRLLLYALILPICYFIYQMHSGYSVQSPFFYGFAENKETELSHDKNARVVDIKVTQGQSVVKGQVLMTIERPQIDYEAQDNDLQASSRQLDYQLRSQEIDSKLLQLDQAFAKYQSETLADIKRLELKDQSNQKVLAALESVEVSPKPSATIAAEISGLRQALQAYQSSYNLKKQQLQAEKGSIRKEANLFAKKLETAQSRLDTDRNRLSIVAPANGVIGNIPTKTDEYVKAFTTLMSFYEEQPTQVKGYVHESLILHVHLEDTLTVASTLRPEHKVTGTVVGLGSRIVEIPERLRKMPTVKTYGREIIVSIPADNSLLQKERVSLSSDMDITDWTSVRRSSTKADRKIEKKLSVK